MFNKCLRRASEFEFVMILAIRIYVVLVLHPTIPSILTPYSYTPDYMRKL